MKPRQNQPSGLETDITRILNPEWLYPFLAFMEMSHLPPDRLYDWAHALLKLYPANAQKVDRRLPLSIEAITDWQTLMYDKKEAEHREKHIADFEQSGALTCCLATIPIMRNQQKKADAPLGTLIVAFERRSETLIHNIVRHEATPMEVLLVAHKLAQLAIKRLDSKKYAEARRYLVMPKSSPEDEWSKQLRGVFESNLPHFASSDRRVAIQKSYDFLKIEIVSDSLKCHVQGRKFTTRRDLWWPVDYDPDYKMAEICCTDDADENAVHDLLAKVSRELRGELKRQATGERASCPPTWQGISRARFKAIKGEVQASEAGETTARKVTRTPPSSSPEKKKGKGRVFRLGPPKAAPKAE